MSEGRKTGAAPRQTEWRRHHPSRSAWLWVRAGPVTAEEPPQSRVEWVVCAPAAVRGPSTTSGCSPGIASTASRPPGEASVVRLPVASSKTCKASRITLTPPPPPPPTMSSSPVSTAVPTIGINGFGRIGRALFRICLDRDDVNMVAVNHTASSIEALLVAIRHDSTHGPCRHSRELSVAPANHPGQLPPSENNPTPSALLYKGKLIHLFSHRDPAKLDWSSAGADYIMESTGKMTTVDKASIHITAAKGKKVIISAPSKDARNIVFGVNHADYAGDDVVSNASCTTNCLAPVASVLHRAFGVESGMMTTIHASTASQKVLDGFSGKDIRSGRSAMGNIIPATTGAAQAVVKVLPELAGKFQGISVRVPVTNVSLVDLTVKTQRPFGSKAELMAAFEAAANTSVAQGGLKGVLGYSEEKLVSSDYLSSSESSIIDVDASIILDDHTAKVVAWYDNEYGFSNRMVDLAIYMAAH